MSHWVKDSLFSFPFSRAKWVEEDVIQNHCNWWQNNFRCFQRLNTKGNNTWGLLVLFIFLQNVFKGRTNGVSERMSADLLVLCSRVNSSQSENVPRRIKTTFLYLLCMSNEALWRQRSVTQHHSVWLAHLMKQHKNKEDNHKVFLCFRIKRCVIFQHTLICCLK